MRVSTGFSDEAEGRRDEELMTHREGEGRQLLLCIHHELALGRARVEPVTEVVRLLVHWYAVEEDGEIEIPALDESACGFAARGPGGRKNRRFNCEEKSGPATSLRSQRKGGSPISPLMITLISLPALAGSGTTVASSILASQSPSQYLHLAACACVASAMISATTSVSARDIAIFVAIKSTLPQPSLVPARARVSLLRCH